MEKDRGCHQVMIRGALLCLRLIGDDTFSHVFLGTSDWTALGGLGGRVGME